MERIFLIGYMGSGKTCMGKMLAQQLNYVFVDMDAQIEKKYHKAVSQIFAEMGEDKFREIERECLHEVADFERTVISTGGGAPCFFDNMDYMNSQGFTVYLKLTPEQLVTRLELSRAGKRPLLGNRKGEDLRLFIEEGLVAREPFYSQAQLIVSGTDEEMMKQVARIA
ncbi:MAG: shikimate kinase [Bacteroidales bacterium]|nr:shikimate kinase [Bacteroidales bacterium]